MFKTFASHSVPTDNACSCYQPAQANIVSYLKQHPQTSKETNPFLSEKKIIDAVAEFFADQDKVPSEVQEGVMLTMHDLGKKLRMPEFTVQSISVNLIDALMDCAYDTPNERP